MEITKFIRSIEDAADERPSIEIIISQCQGQTQVEITTIYGRTVIYLSELQVVLEIAKAFEQSRPAVHDTQEADTAKAVGITACAPCHVIRPPKTHAEIIQFHSTGENL